MIIKITEADRLKSKTAEAAWYKLRITECKGQASKSGKGINFWTTFTIADAPYEGKEVAICFGTAVTSGSVLGSMQFKPYSEMIKLIEAVEGKEVDDTYDTDNLLDKVVDGKLDVFIADGTPINVISTFLPEGKGVNQKSPF